MNVTLTSLEALILKATHESLPQPDVAALEAFSTVMRSSPEGPQLAAQALAARIHSSNAREALLALAMLDRCMRRGDANFHAEVGKFRFLNEMIKLVSPKYFADRTAPEVRTRVLQLLHAWSIEYPKETKFKVAFDMLKNQGVIKETPPPLPPEESVAAARPRAKSAIFEDEEKSKLLQKLLQSKKPEDLQHANRLIKTMVREEERRSEANSRRAQEVSAALDSAGLLRDMLDHAEDASADEEQLIHELHSSCARLRPVLQRLASSDTQTEYLSDILQANDELDEVFEKYNKFVSERKVKTRESKTGAQINSHSLLDFAGANTNKGDGDKLKNSNNNTAIDELGDIFSNNTNTTIIAEPLKPVNLMSTEDNDLGDKNRKVEGWNELDSLGEQLLKQSLPENAKRMDNFNSKHTKKIPMNALEKSPKHDVAAANNNTTLFDLDFFTKKPEEQATLSPAAHSSKSITPNDDVMVDISTDSKSTMNNITNLISKADSPLDNILDLELPLENDIKSINTIAQVEPKDNNSVTVQKDVIKTKSSEVKPLTDVEISLQEVTPSKVPPVTVLDEEEGLTVILHFCTDKPRPDVNVMVLSSNNKNSLPIEDFKLQAVVPKGYKARLLAPSGTALPAQRPFQPAPAVTQVLLVARPAHLPPPSLRLLVSYMYDDDTISDLAEVPALPLDDIH